MFFRKNSRTIIHLGIAIILMGTITSAWLNIQTIFYFIGFFTLIIGITPSIFATFFAKKLNEPSENV